MTIVLLRLIGIMDCQASVARFTRGASAETSLVLNDGVLSNAMFSMDVIRSLIRVGHV